MFTVSRFLCIIGYHNNLYNLVPGWIHCKILYTNYFLKVVECSRYLNDLTHVRLA